MQARTQQTVNLTAALVRAIATYDGRLQRHSWETPTEAPPAARPYLDAVRALAWHLGAGQAGAVAAISNALMDAYELGRVDAFRAEQPELPL